MTEQATQERSKDNSLTEQRAQAEHLQENLRRGGDGKEFKVEEEETVIGDYRRFNVTDKQGAKTEVDISGNGKVEVRGEQKELKNAIEHGERLSNPKTGADGMSNAQSDAINQINASNLSETEKQKLREKVRSHNFAEETQAAEQYTQEIRQEVNQQENSQGANHQDSRQSTHPDEKRADEQAAAIKPQSMALKIMSLRGLADWSGHKSTDAPKSNNMSLGAVAHYMAQKLSNGKP